ncbi:hypothetical protein PILCRDRAFT_817059 [Piloderma croceum F 1598]|uniref:Uncharacterized protein n=1 Tax=Piloderma croceum (strain F 1598) TaxID=765440 RepID=A0A0C3FPB1_PILCF|nr:hypothetical protein PILCRDRAFT_817059 [Piloderma croceum F 1598]
MERDAVRARGQCSTRFWKAICYISHTALLGNERSPRTRLLHNVEPADRMAKHLLNVSGLARVSLADSITKGCGGPWCPGRLT